MRAQHEISISRGFTLIELVIVMLVMGIMAAVAAPRYFDSLASFRSKAAAKRIEADLELARRHAQRNSTAQRVVFDVALDTYLLDGLPDMVHPEDAYSVSFSQTSYPVDVVTADFGSTPIVTFDNYGRPDNPGTVVVRYGNYTRTIDVDPNGIVKITP